MSSADQRPRSVLSLSSEDEQVVSLSYQTEQLSKLAAGAKKGRNLSSSSSSATSSNLGANREQKVRRDHSSRRHQGTDACFKRNKIDELQFAASRVKEDLEKGGLRFPDIHDAKRRLEILDGITAPSKGIHILSSRSLPSSSPFLTKHFDAPLEFSNTNTLAELFAVTYESYCKQQSPNGTSSSNWSGTCSLTSDSDSSRSVPFEIPPLLETALRNKKANTKYSSGDDATNLNETEVAVYSKPITIGEAFENSEEPR